MIRTRHVILLLAVSFLGPASTAAAQEAVEEGATVGYELALTGSVATERGSSVRLSGIAYEVEGLATLRPTAGLVIDGEILAYQQDGTTRVAGSASARATEGGHFEISLLVPEESLSGAFVRLRVHRAAGAGRVFDFALAQLASRLASLLTDRDRYEPGETVHVFSLLRSTRGLAPIARRAVRIELLDPTQASLAERELETSAAGVATMDVELPASAIPGTYQVRIAFDPASPPTVRTIEVFQRTTERVMATMTLDQELLGPSERLTGRIRVTTPSGVAIRGAQVELHVGSGSGELTQLVTDDAGVALIDTNAPSFLSGEAEIQSAWARITHPAYGSITASASYTLSRTRWLVSATPEGGGLIPEIDSQLFLTVADPRGRPITAGTSVEVRGLGIAGGHATATTDAHGVAVVTVRLPRGAAARLSGGACGSSEASTTLEVEIGTTPPVTASVCSQVALQAGVLVRAQAPIVTPGARVDVDITRRPLTQGRGVLLEALFQGRAIAFSWIAGSASHGSLSLPSDLSGVITIRARPVAPADARSPVDQPGATSFGIGSTTAVLVRPADAFALTVTPDQPLHAVQEHAMVSLTTSTPPTQAWAALVARDEAQQGGEDDFAIEWILGELREAIRAGAGSQHDRYVRAALAAGLALDTRATVAPPLVPEAWDDGSRYYGHADGILRDPIAMREELVRRGIAQVMVALEGLVQQLSSDQELRDLVTRSTGRRVEFAPDVLRYMVDQGLIGAPTTLGGQPMTVAMLTASDPSFSFDAAARRVARARLVNLLVALSALTNADDEAALRASAGAPPDRWLSLLVQLGMLTPEALVDPWGHAFVLRRVTGRHPAVVVSERAVDWELSSPGPDGVPGNADDVRDPFQRAIPRGTPYAVACGEDALLAQLSTIAPGEQVLAAMATAYQRLGLAAQEERRGGVVTATTSESTATPMAPPMEAQLQALGYDSGGEGMGYGRGAPTTVAPAPSRMARSEDDALGGLELEEERAREAPDQDADGIVDVADAITTAGALIREDFPATLFFIGEVAFDAAGHATVDVPLADAITTYRLEAIAWTSSGWITSGRGSVRVDQEAMVDAPVPEAATIGDVLRLPVRVQNRTDAVLRAQLSVAVEGEIAVDVGALSVLEVEPHGAAEQIVTLTVRAGGEGALVIRAAREDGRALDAVRRDMRVFDDARLVREHRESLIEDGGSLSIDLPHEAQNRGPAQLRLSVAGAIFGSPDEIAAADPFWAAFALAMDGVPLPDGLADQLASWVRFDERYGSIESYYYGRDAQQVALAIAAMWNDPRLDDRSIGGAIRYLGVIFAEGGEGEAVPYYGAVRSPSLTLLALAPAVRSTGRPELRDALDVLVGQLRRAASTEGASAVEAPEAWARVAAALFLSRRAGDDDARAVEMLRRTERSVITVGDIAWLEPDAEDGAMEPRVSPTSLLALARIAHGDRRGALPLIRSLAEVARGAPRWPAPARALAATAAALLATGPGDGPLDVRLDGVRVETHLEDNVVVAMLDGATRPGSHTLTFDLPDGALALLRVDLRYGMPWDVAPLREAPISIEWTGETGARDTRSGLSVTVQNRGTRVLTHPIVEIEMPAGTELDEPTREALAGLLVSPASMEGTTLHLELRPMAPAGYVRIPIRARWAVSGSLRGLGVSVYDEAGPGASGLRPTAILPSRAVEIADHGPETTAEEPESSPPPRPPPPPPILRPLAEVVR